MRYGFTGTGDSPDLLLTAGGAVVERYVSLPGGVLHRKGYAVGATGSWSVSNLHGDVIATVSGGAVTAGCVYDPFGQPLNPASGVVDTTAVPATTCILEQYLSRSRRRRFRRKATDAITAQSPALS